MASSANDISSTSQQYLDIHDIANDILILKDGSTSLVLTVNAMNFGLLAEPEQDAIMYAYAGLLNSLNYPIQIVIRSQTKDVTSYLHLLKQEEDAATSDIRRNWIARYRQFVGELIRERNVLDKKFYVVIPATALEMGFMSAGTILPGAPTTDITKVDRSVIFDKAKEILEPKRDYLIAQFGRIGLQSRQLNTQEIIQLFYVSYNPEAAEGQQITDTSSYTTPLVQASMQGGFMSDQHQFIQPDINPAEIIAPVQPQPQIQPQTPTLTQPQPAVSMPEQPMAAVTPEMQIPPTPEQPLQPPVEPQLASIQNEIDASLQELGQAPTMVPETQPPVIQTIQPTQTDQSQTQPQLPPLPEI